MFKVGDKVRIKNSAKGRYGITTPGSEGIIERVSYRFEGNYLINFYKLTSNIGSCGYYDIMEDDLELIEKPLPKNEAEWLDRIQENFKDG